MNNNIKIIKSESKSNQTYNHIYNINNIKRSRKNLFNNY